MTLRVVSSSPDPVTKLEVIAELRGVTRVYGGRQGLQALGPIDLDLVRGEFFSVVGPSG